MPKASALNRLENIEGENLGTAATGAMACARALCYLWLANSAGRLNDEINFILSLSLSFADASQGV